MKVISQISPVVKTPSKNKSLWVKNESLFIHHFNLVATKQNPFHKTLNDLIRQNKKHVKIFMENVANKNKNEDRILRKSQSFVGRGNFGFKNVKNEKNFKVLPTGSQNRRQNKVASGFC